jgi:hypothetical protein
VNGVFLPLYIQMRLAFLIRRAQARDCTRMAPLHPGLHHFGEAGRGVPFVVVFASFQLIVFIMV